MMFSLLKLRTNTLLPSLQLAEQTSGQLRLLRSAHDIDDYAVELPPDVLKQFEGTYWREAELLLRAIEVRDGAQ